MQKTNQDAKKRALTRSSPHISSRPDIRCKPSDSQATIRTKSCLTEEAGEGQQGTYSWLAGNPSACLPSHTLPSDFPTWILMSPGSFSRNLPPELTEMVSCCQRLTNGQGSILNDGNNQGLLSGISQESGMAKSSKLGHVSVRELETTSFPFHQA